MSALPNDPLVPDTAEKQAGADLAADEIALLERNLRLTPEQRLDQLVRVVRFVEAGRTALKRACG